MRFLSAAAVLALSGVFLGSAPAHAATGEVVVFTTEFEDLVRYEDPASGSCTPLSPTAHVLVNLTDTEVSLHPGRGCFGSGVTVSPDRGWHAPPSGMFSYSVA